MEHTIEERKGSSIWKIRMRGGVGDTHVVGVVAR